MRVFVNFKDVDRKDTVFREALSCEPEGLWIRVVNKIGTSVLFPAGDIKEVVIKPEEGDAKPEPKHRPSECIHCARVGPDVCRREREAAGEE